MALCTLISCLRPKSCDRIEGQWALNLLGIINSKLLSCLQRQIQINLRRQIQRNLQQKIQIQKCDRIMIEGQWALNLP